MNRPIPIGISDFRTLRERGMEYVDKSHLVRAVLDKGAESILLPRPRRFGKTLNLSMLRCFFEEREEDLSALFADLAIWQAGDAYRKHFQRYPTLFITFKDVKAETWEHAWEGIRKNVEVLFDEHRYLLDGGHLSEMDARDYRALLDGTAGPAVYERALADLSKHLHAHHGERVVILVDEYDQPIHAGYLNGYTQQAVAFFRAFLGGALKDNPHLFKGVLTRILRIAKESIFSGLNNLAVYTLLVRDFSTAFGFTEPEVYHAFVIGLLATLEPEHLVRSNRESGKGRPDVTVRPRLAGKLGAVLELKVAKAGKKTPEQALEEGFAQIEEKRYAAELHATGAAPVHAFAVAFDGKTVWVRSGAPRG